MEPPIPSGTILQNRYYLIRVLGQGGFGRTYLAEDRNRFNEPCALKELIPPQTEAYVLDKSRELFQREATTLYQIKHPQVPEFRATFEEDGRLFLVQDYVEGKTYRDLLNERLAYRETQLQPPHGDPESPPPTRVPGSNNPVFTEVEVKQLLQQLLPVLQHIHTKGIIHRDITPDNIIQRSGDSLPVLIDFGVVKELATRFHSPDASTPATTVGKLGYAPSEQIQTGRSYPSSDLYSLAVSAVVLLTGKEPRDLLDNTQLTWNWRRWVNVSDPFAQVLNRMLSYRPGDRYQSAMEVIQALSAPASPPPQAPDPDVSRMATVAVGRRPDPESPSVRRPEEEERQIPDPNTDSFWNNPGAVIGIGVGAALLTGLASWALVSTFVNRPEPQPTSDLTESPTPLPTETETPTPTPTETETPTPTPTETETPTPTPTTPTVSTQRLNLTAGKALEISRNIRPNTIINYTFQGKQDQQLQAFIPTEGVYMTILSPDGEAVANQAKRVQQWQGKLPLTGVYSVQVSLTKELPARDYDLQLTLTDPVQPKPTPTATTPPSYDTEPLTIPEGEPTIQFDGQTTPQKVKRYLVNVDQGQQLAAEVIQGNVTLDIRYPNGQLVEDGSGVKFWQNSAPRGGEYMIDVISQRSTNFTLSVSVTNP